MSTENSVTLIGNLVDDPELRFTPSGVPMAKIRFAVNRSYKQGDEWVQDTSYFNGTAWRDIADHIADSFRKGDRVIVVGRLEQRSWKTDDGENRSVVEVAVEEMGASVKFATAAITRISRDDRQAPPSSREAGSRPQARDDYGPDEAPF